MGAPFSPAIANIFMSVFFRNFLSKQTKHPVFLKRYIDDIFIIWNHDVCALELFLNHLNVYHPHISALFT